MAIIGTLPIILTNGTVADASQVMADFNFIVNQVNSNALPVGTISSGSLIGLQIITALGAFSYTPTSGASSLIAEIVGAGGAGGGVVAAGAGASIAGGGGGAGAYIFFRKIGGLTGLTGTIGAGGAGTTGTGGTGGATSFAGLNAGGGIGGASVAASSPSILGAPGAGGVPTGGNININGITGEFGFCIVAGGATLSGQGASTRWGVGGQASGLNGTGSVGGANAGGFGAGGGGAVGVNNGATAVGGNGSQGVVIIYEFA